MKGLLLILAAISALSASAAPVPGDGSLFVPSDGLTHPGIVVISQDASSEATALAARGFAVLAIQKAEADLSKTYEAFRWLRASTYVQGKPTALYGVSEGAEPALALAVYLSKRMGRFSPNAVAVHAAPYRLTSDWNWNGSIPGLMQGQEFHIERYSGDLLITQGMNDTVSGAHEFEALLRAAGAAVRATNYPGGSSTGPEFVRAEFDYFDGQGKFFDPHAEELRRELVAEFFVRKMSGR